MEILHLLYEYEKYAILNILRNIVDLERKGQVSGCLESSPLDVENKKDRLTFGWKEQIILA